MAVTKRVLVCDDEPAVRECLRTALEADGYEVAEAVDGLEAVVKAREVQPDLVLLDLVMPHVDGFQAIPLIREVAPDTAIVVVTSHSSVEALALGRKLGARACVPKEQFVPRVSELVARFCSR